MGIVGPARPRDRAGARARTSSQALALEYARIAAELRAAGLNVEVYGGDDKLGKQFKYADRAGVPLAILYGSREHDAGVVKIKDLRMTDANATNKEIDGPARRAGRARQQRLARHAAHAVNGSACKRGDREHHGRIGRGRVDGRADERIDREDDHRLRRGDQRRARGDLIRRASARACRR